MYLYQVIVYHNDHNLKSIIMIQLLLLQIE